jgi:acetyl esterase/lipase
MRVKTQLFIALLLILLVSCNSEEAMPPTPTPEPTPEPTPAFDVAKLGTAVTDITYCTPNDLPQKLDVYYPQSGGPWSVLVYVHGGSWINGDKAEGEGWRGMNEQGYLVVSLNYRMAADGKFPVMIEDVKCAVRYLRANSADYNIDPDRIGAIGASAGGHLVALLGTADESAGWDVGEYTDQSSRVQAVVTMAGPADFTAKMTNTLNSSIYYVFGKLAGSDDPINIAASPVTYISPDTPPFLIIHGDLDNIVPVEQAEILHARLTEASIPSQLVVVTGGGHGLDGREATPTWAEINEMILDFFKKHLQ